MTILATSRLVDQGGTGARPSEFREVGHPKTGSSNRCGITLLTFTPTTVVVLLSQLLLSASGNSTGQARPNAKTLGLARPDLCYTGANSTSCPATPTVNNGTLLGQKVTRGSAAALK